MPSTIERRSFERLHRVAGRIPEPTSTIERRPVKALGAGSRHMLLEWVDQDNLVAVSDQPLDVHTIGAAHVHHSRRPR